MDFTIMTINNIEECDLIPITILLVYYHCKVLLSTCRYNITKCS